MDWIDANQLGRRNLTPDAFRLLLGRRYNRQKGKREDNLKQNTPKDQYDPSVNTADKLADQYVVKDQVDPLPTADKLADQYAVSAATVKRAGKFAEQVARTPHA